MTFISEFADMMPDTVTVVPGINNEFGEFTPSGATFSVRCHIEAANRLFRNSEGREVVSSVQVYTDGIYGLTSALHRYILPSDALPAGRARVALAVFPEHDELGPAFDVVYF